MRNGSFLKHSIQAGSIRNCIRMGKYMRRIKLTKQEKAIEEALIKGEYVDAPKSEFYLIAEALALRKKDAVLNIRVNSRDLANIKRKAKRFGVKYQTFIAELIHRAARA